MELKFRIEYLDDALSFLEELPEKAREKISNNILKVMCYHDKDLFKKLKGSEIWEFRTLYTGVAYRLFAFWDTSEETLVVATHGIVKKTWKVQKKDIAKAEAIRKAYFQRKNK
ncbi:MAG: type II toxin-antitoxin system RelE/ParE family toxin [Prevotellaceae bacterium]|nr:type II toxin-antitoxin system RelE/ParE family toxin [Prevotellaceae bacterium]